MAQSGGGTREKPSEAPKNKNQASKDENISELQEESPKKGSCLGRMAFLIATVTMLLAAAIIILWAASKAGWINIGQGMQKIPLLGSILPKDESTKDVVVPGATLLERENQRLLQEVNSQKSENQQLTAEKKTLEEYNRALTEKVSLLEKSAPQPKTNPVAEMDFKKLSEYFTEMKPANAVAIMDKMDDDTVLGILRLMDSDKVAKILAVMQPERAATLSSKVKVQP